MPSNIEEYLNGVVTNFGFSKFDLDGEKNNIYNGAAYPKATTNLKRLYQGQVGAQVWSFFLKKKNGAINTIFI